MAHTVAREIINDVVSSGSGPGTMLPPESIMREQYEVSRASLREALRIMELLGFIQVKPGPGGGPILTEVGPQQFADTASLYYEWVGATYRELLETRKMVEPSVARLAAERRDKKDIRQLHDYVDRARAIDVKDDRHFRTVGQDFHDLLAGVARNKVMTLMVGSCYHVFADRTAMYMYAARYRGNVLNAHEKIAEAVISGDREAAASIMYEHMDDYMNQAVKRFEGIMSEIVRW
jgi:DNA-binding FadR family transcriptional regulator